MIKIFGSSRFLPRTVDRRTGQPPVLPPPPAERRHEAAVQAAAEADRGLAALLAYHRAIRTA
jgi:hypothetical protein